MAVATGGRTLPVAALLVAGGGVAAAVGAFLPWENLSFLGESEFEVGLEGNAGKVIVVFGVIAVIAAVTWILRAKLPAVRLFGIPVPEAVSVAAGVAVLLAVAFNYSGISADMDFAAGMDVSASIGIGYYLDAVAGIVTVVGGAIGLLTRRY